MTFQEAEALHPGFKAYVRESFVGNECDTDEYGETQPGKGFGYIADWFEVAPEPDAGDMLALILAWVEAIQTGGRYDGADQLVPILALYFDALWDQGKHPYDQEPDELLAWFLEDAPGQ